MSFVACGERNGRDDCLIHLLGLGPSEFAISYITEEYTLYFDEGKAEDRMSILSSEIVLGKIILKDSTQASI